MSEKTNAGQTPILERSFKQTDDAIAILHDVSALCEKAIAQRDELAAALEELLACHVPGSAGSRTYNARENAKAALQKLGGK